LEIEWNMQKHDIYERVTNFAVRVIKFSEKLSRGFSGKIIAKQLVRAATSVGANLQEADGAISRNDFVNKSGIARKEAQESRYWLNLIGKSELVQNRENLSELNWLHNESDEIAKILSSIINKARKQ